jgi:hypothetical protein
MNPRNALNFRHYMPGNRAALLDGRRAIRVIAAGNLLQQHAQSSSVATVESARVLKPSITFLRAGIRRATRGTGSIAGILRGAVGNGRCEA